MTILMLAVGLFIGVFVGLCLGWLLRERKFDRDREIPHLELGDEVTVGPVKLRMLLHEVHTSLHEPSGAVLVDLTHALENRQVHQEGKRRA